MLVFDTVPAFKNTWIEDLGDLGCYMVAITFGPDREVWQNIARSWFRMAADEAPYVGRLYYHLAIIAHPDPLQQLFYYCKSLAASEPFTPSRIRILTAFDPIEAQAFSKGEQSAEASFVHLHSIVLCIPNLSILMLPLTTFWICWISPTSAGR